MNDDTSSSAKAGAEKPTSIEAVKNPIAYTGLAVLVVLAILGKSAVMLVSVLGMGFMFWRTRATALSKRLLATASGALLGSWGAEAVHTVYHMFESQPSGVAGDNGFFFVGATLVGLINAGAFVTILLLVEWLMKPKDLL